MCMTDVTDMYEYIRCYMIHHRHVWAYHVLHQTHYDASNTCITHQTHVLRIVYHLHDLYVIHIYDVWPICHTHLWPIWHTWHGARHPLQWCQRMCVYNGAYTCVYTNLRGIRCDSSDWWPICLRDRCGSERFSIRACVRQVGSNKAPQVGSNAAPPGQSSAFPLFPPPPLLFPFCSCSKSSCEGQGLGWLICEKYVRGA